jgi:Putative MetA-pathway of phenol degradation
MSRPLVVLAIFWSVSALPLLAQLPFYTDDPAVTDPGKVHFELFEEIDGLQRPQFPNLRQNTLNYKVNVGLPYGLEVDVDAPYLAIFRATGIDSSVGMGDVNLGMKWQFHKESGNSWLPALGASLYIEFPSGDASQQLGSGLNDYWLNLIAQKSLSAKTRVNGNLGYLFAGNTSTGVIGITNTRGHVITGGLSILHDFNPRLTLGVELYGGAANLDDLARDQFQIMAGGQFKVREGLSVDFGLIAGRYAASPRVGGQVGFSVDFPDVARRAH